MNLDNVCIALRPRPKNLAMDLGFKLGRRWFWPLAGIFLLYTGPLFIGLLLIFPEHANWIGLGLWWLLPFFERPLCYYLSLAVFGHEARLSHIIEKTPFLLSRQTLGWLTYKRFNFNRSFLCPIVILENLDKKRYRSRANILGASVGRTPSWLAFVCAHLVYAMSYGILLFVYFLKPSSLPSDWEHVDLSDADVVAQLDGMVSYLEGAQVITMLGFYSAFVIITPFFVAAGFSLYLNQRTRLEGWDIDIQFKRILAKLSKAAFLLPLLSFSLLTMPLPSEAQASSIDSQSNQSDKNGIFTQVVDLTADAVSSPKKKGLHPLQEEERKKILAMDKQLMLEEEVVTRWRLKEKYREQEKADKKRQDYSGLAFFVRIVIWVLGALIAVFLAYHIYQYIIRQQFSKKPTRSKSNNGKVVATEEKAAEEKEKTIKDVLSLLHHGKPRDALVALWLVFSAHMGRRYNIPLKPHMTEQECYAMSKHYIRDPKLMAYMKTLLAVKLQACYSGVKVSRVETQDVVDAYLKLCEGTTATHPQGGDQSDNR